MKRALTYRNVVRLLKACRGIALFIILFFACGNLTAQDIHFSQFYATPALLNPASTGNFTGRYRIGINYRTQWSSVTVPWRTYDMYADMSFLKEKRKRKIFVGTGILLARDEAGDGVLTTTKILAGTAIHYKINRQEMHTFSMGMQLGIIQKNIDWTKLYFDNQWIDGGFDRSLATMENYSYSRITYPDLSFGLLYQDASNKNYNYYISLSENHIIQPKETFYKIGSANQLGVRTVFSAGISFKIAGAFAAAPAIEYMNQKKASETTLGLMLGYNLSNYTKLPAKVYGGLYNRFGDALIPVIGGEYGPWRSFISYDSNYSKLNTASKGYGAFELSLVYTGGIPKYRTIGSIACPRF